MWKLFFDSAFFELGLSFNFKELELNKFVVLRKASEFCERAARFCPSIVVNKPSRSKWHKDHASSKDQIREELKGKRYEPRGVALTFAGSPDVVLSTLSKRVSIYMMETYGPIVNPERDEATKFNGDLL
jgi:hypothetical protein